MTTANKPAVRAFAAAMAAVLGVQVASAAMAGNSPIVVWDGAAGSEYDFSTLTRTVNGVTYTLSANAENATVSADCITIGSENQKWPVKITADAEGAFGTAGQVTVILKCDSLNLADNTYRGIIGLIDADGAFYSGDNNVKIAIATGYNTSYGVGVYGYYIANGVFYKQIKNATAFSSGEQTIALTYDSVSAGSAIYLNGSLISSDATAKYGDWLSPDGIVLGGMDKDGSSRVYAQTGMKIKAVAVFTSTLSAEQVAEYTFPSVLSNTTVSDINAMYGSATKIDVYLADGATITGDTTFNATKVNFHCEGSFSITPPADNEATFDFSDVSGRPVVVYSALPSVSGTKFTSNVVPSFVTDATQWTGVIYISSATVTDFTVNTFGNESSVVRLGDITGWLKTSDNVPFTNSVPVELAGTLYLNNGNSANDTYPNRCTVFKKLSGSGAIAADSSAPKVVVVIQDASEFTGNIGLSNKIIVFGEKMPSYTDNNTFEGMTGSIWVMEGASVTAQPASENWWAIGGIKVAGELRAANLDKFGGGTYITTFDTGVFTLTSTGNGVATETETSYARITGTGSLKYEGTGWRAISTNNFPTAMTVVNEQAGNLLMTVPGITYEVGSLAGSGMLEANYVNQSAARYLRVLQSKDTEWSGTVKADSQNRFGGLIVAPGVSAAGTLTLSGTQTQSAALTVETGAKVNLTGTWVGATTVAGTLGGTGAITGNLTLSDGATLKVDDLSDPLAVTGNFSAPTGAVTVDLPAGTNAGAKFLSASGEIATGASFTVTLDGVKSPLKVIKTAGGLKAVYSGLKIILR